MINQYDPQQPIQSYVKRLVVNYKNITLFVKNMPENDELIGRLRDHLATMISVASDKIDFLCKKQESHEYIRRSYSILEEIDSRRLKNTNKSLSQMEDLLYRLEENFVAWGMSEEQEKQLITLVEQSLDESHQSNKEEKQLDSEQHRELSIILGILQNLG